MELTHSAVHQLRVIVSQAVRDELLEARERALTYIIPGFSPNNLQNSPRSAIGILWYLDPASALLTIQSKLPATAPGLIGSVQSATETKYPLLGATVNVRLYCNFQKTPPARLTPELQQAVRLRTGRAYRSGLVIVPEEERRKWLLGRLKRAGLTAEPDTVEISGVGPARIGRSGRSIPAAEVSARATVHDASQIAEAICSGVGKGKCFGLGLLRLGLVDD